MRSYGGSSIQRHRSARCAQAHLKTVTEYDTIGEMVRVVFFWTESIDNRTSRLRASTWTPYKFNKRGVTAMTQPTMSETVDRLLTDQQVIQITNIPRSTMYELMKRGSFPRQVSLINPLTKKRNSKSLWRLSDVQDWIRSLPIRQESDTEKA